MRLFRRNNLFLLALSMLAISNDSLSITSLAKNDPDPMFSTLDPQTFLYTRKKLILKGYDVSPDRREYIGISISPFGVNANFGQDAAGYQINLGDINGQWDMIALLYGNLPAGKSYGPVLSAAQSCVFPSGVGLNNPDYIDKNSQYGFFTIPLVYRKRGLRFEFDANIFDDFGISIQTSVTDMSQTLSVQAPLSNLAGIPGVNIQGFINLTPPPNPANPIPGTGSDLWLGNSGCEPGISICAINKCLMYQLSPIAQEICLDIENFHTVSIEEVRINGYWRHAFSFNLDSEEDWPEFLLIPFLQVTGSFSPGRLVNPNKAFAVPFGNNGYNAAGFNTGVNIDFFDTIEIGGEFDYTHFFQRDCVTLRMPNSPYQSGIYPFSTTANYQPGDNWRFAAKMAAYHFIDRLSMYFQWNLIEHRRDKICLTEPDPAYYPQVLEETSDWKIQVANVGFNYDISPYISLGFLWQAPLNQHNVYRSSTVMLGLSGSY